MKETIFYVAGLDCPVEESLIRNRLERLEGVDTLKFNLMTRELTVVHRIDDERNLQAALDTLELGARLKVSDEEDWEHEHAEHEHSGHEHCSHEGHDHEGHDHEGPAAQ